MNNWQSMQSVNNEIRRMKCSSCDIDEKSCNKDPDFCKKVNEAEGDGNE